MFAAPASAHPRELSGKAVCDHEKGAWVVTWTLVNKWNDSGKLVGAAWTPVEDVPTGANIGDPIAPATQKGDTLTATQIVKNGTAGEATMNTTVAYDRDPGTKFTNEASVPLGTDCTVSQPAPPPPPPAPTPTPTGSSAAPPAALPKTGSNTALYAGGALLLTGAGTGMFLVARRRRIKFVA
jgi:LPXTG-motif cell wall-anchored protein